MPVEIPKPIEATAQRGWLFANEKIYTILVVILIIWAGVVILLMLTNRRISRLEKMVDQSKEPTKMQP